MEFLDKSSRYFLCVLVAFLFSPLSYGEIYRWVDESGRVSFGDKRVYGVTQEALSVKPPPSDWLQYDISIDAHESDITASEIERIKIDVNNVYRFYDHVMSFNLYKTVPVKIQLFSSEEPYYRHLRERLGREVEPSRGIFLRNYNEIVVYLRKNREGTFRTIKHEVSHAIINTIAPRTPVWLNEGLAEQMEMIEEDEGSLVIEKHSENWNFVSYKVRQGSIPELSNFLDVSSGAFRDKQKVRGNGLQSITGEIVGFCLSTGPDRSFISRILHEYSRGNKFKSLYLVDNNYIGSISSMQIKWDNYLKSGGLSHPIRL